MSDFNDFSNTRPLAIGWNQSQIDWAGYLATSGQDAHSLTSEPLFVNPAAFDFSLQPASPLIGKGVILARTTDAGSGSQVIVTDASYFSDGFGIGSGDTVVIGSNHAKIVSIDYLNQTIGIDRVLNWGKNDPVSFPFAGAAPDLGASNIP